MILHHIAIAILSGVAYFETVEGLRPKYGDEETENRTAGAQIIGAVAVVALVFIVLRT